MTKPVIANFEGAVAYLYDMPRFTAKHTLEDTKRFLRKMGNPEKGMNIIHVAGTNGKGSVCAYIRSILEEAGKSVCVFTSPHLVDIRERFLVKGNMITKECFLDAFHKVLDMLDWNALEAGEGYHPTFFEFLFFMAMLIFRDASADYCILETGLGGRLDATNSVSSKSLSVITRISLDHVEYLGDTEEKIAGEKAGILMENVPAVFWDTSPMVTAVFVGKAKELGIKGHPVSKNDYAFLNFQNKSIDFLMHTLYYGDMKLSLNTIASYQMENAALAVRAVEILSGGNISEGSIKKGVRKCFWQGRMEEVLPGVYVDGAHNEDGIRAFLDSVRVDGVEEGRMLVFGVVADKDYVQMIAEIAASGLFSRIAIVRLKTGRAADGVMLKEVFEKNGTEHCSLFDDSGTALRTLLAEREKQRIYIAGSLYLVGEIKEFLINDQF